MKEMSAQEFGYIMKEIDHYLNPDLTDYMHYRFFAISDDLNKFHVEKCLLELDENFIRQ